MTPYRRTNQKIWVVTLRTGNPAKPYDRLSTGTYDRATAERMEAMLELLGERGRRWLWIPQALITRRVDLPTVYDHYVAGTLEQLQEQLADVDLRDLHLEWETDLARQVRDGTLAEETVRKYRQQTLVLVGLAAPIWKSSLTPAAVKTKLDAVQGSGTNRRRHAAAWTSFLEYCVERGALETNPLRAFRLPKSNRTKLRYAEWAHVVRLLHAMPAGLHQALAAVRHGAGLEMQAALRMTRKDVLLADRVVWAHGSKTEHRDRQAIVLDDQCWELFSAYVKAGAFLPDAKLFPIGARAHAVAQAAAVAQLRAEGVDIREGYTLHAARHSFGVEMKRRGYEDKLIAANFGHANERLVQSLYGKYKATAGDLIASAQRAQGGR